MNIKEISSLSDDIIKIDHLIDRLRSASNIGSISFNITRMGSNCSETIQFKKYSIEGSEETLISLVKEMVDLLKIQKEGLKTKLNKTIKNI